MLSTFSWLRFCCCWVFCFFFLLSQINCLLNFGTNKRCLTGRQGIRINCHCHRHVKLKKAFKVSFVGISGEMASRPCLAAAPAQTPLPPLPTPITPATPPLPPTTTMTTHHSGRMPAPPLPTTWLPHMDTLTPPYLLGGGPMMGGGHPSTVTRGRSPTCLVLVTEATTGI